MEIEYIELKNVHYKIRRLRAEMISGTLVACLFIAYLIFQLQLLIVEAIRGERNE